MKKTIAAICSALICLNMCAFAACGPDDGNDDKVTVQFAEKQYAVVTGLEEASSASASVRVTVNGEAKEKPSVTYTVGDPELAEVNAQGVITAKSAGYTTLTAKYKNVETAVPLTVYGKVTDEQINGFGKEYVNLFGRNYESEGGMKFDHAASGVEVAIYGESFSADVTVTPTDGQECYVRVFVDDDQKGEFKKLETQEGFTFASGLSAGLHRIRVLKSSELVDATFTLKNLSSEQFLTAPYKSDYKIEFIGDSLTTGFGALGKNGDDRTPANSDACNGLAYPVVQLLGVDFSVVAMHGICVNVNIWQQNYKMSTMYPVVSPFHTEEYDFNDGVDMVVLSLGSNDAGYIDQHPSYRSQFPVDYQEFLTYIREKRPNAKIVCTCRKTNTVEDSVKEAISNMNDANISYYEYATNFEGAVAHPSATFNQKLATAFAKFLREHM